MAQIVARNYAQAFLNVFGPSVTTEVADAIKQLCIFFCNHSRVTFFFKLALIPDQIKCDKLRELCDRFGAPYAMIEQLALLLLKHRRLAMLPSILCAIRELWLDTQHIFELRVTSADELADAERAQIQQFCMQHIGSLSKYGPRSLLKDVMAAQVICLYEVDARLIAGIRIQSVRMLWERSVARQIRLMHVALRS